MPLFDRFYSFIYSLTGNVNTTSGGGGSWNVEVRENEVLCGYPSSYIFGICDNL